MIDRETEPAAPKRGRRALLAVGCGLLVSGAIVSDGQAAGVASWHQRGVNGATNGPAVAGGRVWWVEGEGAGPGEPVRLLSRALTGDRARTVRLVLPPALAVGGTEGAARCVFDAVGSIRLRVEGGQAFLAGDYSAQAYADVCADQPFVARYTAADGTALPLAFPDVVPYAIDFPPVTTLLSVLPPASDGSRTVADWGTGPTPTAIPADAAAPQTAGRFTGWAEGRSSRFGLGYAGRRWDRFRVVETMTDRTVYVVTAERIARAAAGRSAEVALPSLQDDGSLAVAVSKTGKRVGVRPVRVDGSGAVRAVGRRQPNAVYAATLVAHGRAFVQLSGGRLVQRGKHRVGSCDGLWMTSTTGGRGRLLGRYVDLGSQRARLPLFWDGDAAVWTYGDAENAVRVDSRLDRLSLSARERPSCARR